MFRFVVLLLPAVALAAQLDEPTMSTQSPEAALLGLAASADQILGNQPIDIKFSCANRPYGHYADMGNDCKVYHMCNPQMLNDGQHVVIQHSFFCPSGQTFDQQFKICTLNPTVPCDQSEKYYSATEVGTVVTAPVVNAPVQTIESRRPVFVEHAAPVRYETAGTTVNAQTTSHLVDMVVPSTAVHVPTNTVAVSATPVTEHVVSTVQHVTPTRFETTGSVLNSRAPAQVVDVVVPSAAVNVPTKTVAVSTPVTSTQLVQPLNFQTTQQVQRVYTQQPIQVVGYPTLNTLQHAAHFIKHFPEPNFHPLTVAVPNKVFRAG